MDARTQTTFRVSEVALQLFVDRGYDNVTVDDVAAAAGVSRRTVFRHFGGKEELPFPDHEQRRADILEFFERSSPDDDPVEIAMAMTEATLRDFISRPDLVLRRYELTRIVPQLAEREVIEHDKYAMQNRRFLRSRLPESTPDYQIVGITALMDSVHRATLTRWTHSGGTSDAVAELREGLDWVRGLLRPPAGDMASPAASSPETFVAVLPHDDRTAAVIESLRALSRVSDLPAPDPQRATPRP